MTRPIGRSMIKRLGNAYQKWLYSRDWFNSMKPSTKETWTASVEKLISAIDNAAPALMWEAAVDHWHDTPWEEDNLPQPWETLYDAIDEYRERHDVDSTNVDNWPHNA